MVFHFSLAVLRQEKQPICEVRRSGIDLVASDLDHAAGRRRREGPGVQISLNF